MPPYEVLALLALAAVGGFAYYVSRQPAPPGEDAGAPPKRMFAREPEDRDGKGPDGR